MDITDIGPFKKITVPPDWRRNTLRVPQANRMELPIIQLTMPGKEQEMEIGIFYRGKLESEDDGENFHALLLQHREAEQAVTLSPGQIRSLSRVLDLAGFNQYTYPRHLTGYSPDFFLKTAQVIVINGKPVLKVDGEFRDEDKTDTFYGGLFVEADDSGRKIYELYLRVTAKELHLKGIQFFRRMAESIEWAD